MSDWKAPQQWLGIQFRYLRLRTCASAAAVTIGTAVLGFNAQSYAATSEATITVNRDSVTFQRGRSAHIVSTASDEVSARYLAALVDYTSKVLEQPTIVIDSLGKLPVGQSAIVFQFGYQGLPATVASAVTPRTDEDFALSIIEQGGRRVVLVAAGGPNGFRRAVQKLVIDSQQDVNALKVVVASGFYSPWIEQREFQPVTWSPTRVRAKFTNSAVDPRVDYHRYTDQQLNKYLAAFDWFGYDGIRIEEGAWQYAIFGSIEKEQAFVRRVAAAAVSNSMMRTLHMLYADFTGYGWVDPTVVYEPADGLSAAEDPKVQATFNKYYDHYADLALDFDRMGGHLIDPGYLKNGSDLVYYAKLLIDKVRSRNPKLVLDVVFWLATPELVREFTTAGLTNVDFLLSNYPTRWNAEAMRSLHQIFKDANIRLGYWSWYIADMEQDHRASMYVNAQLLKSEFHRIRRDVDDVYHPTYWSEMEGYHLLNMFSMYVSAQLQWNPDRDPNELLLEIATGIWGPVSGQKMFDVLRLIEDVRTGPNFDSYWTSLRPGNKPATGELGTDDPGLDLQRANSALASLKSLVPDAGFVQKFPLPFSANDYRDLIVPHIQQIADYSEFCVGVAKVRKAAAQGASKERLADMMREIWRPVPEYNTWIGMGGTIELNAQVRAIQKIEQDFGIVVKDPDALIQRDADRIAETLGRRQAYSPTPLLWKIDPNGRGSSWDSDHLIDQDFLYLKYVDRGAWRDRLILLLQRGDITEVQTSEGTRYQLTKWRDWALTP
jgi:hypothetical protein